MAPIVDAHFVDRDDVRMLELCNGLGLGAESLDEPGFGELAGKQHLDRNNPVQAPLPGLIDDPHPSASNHLQQIIIPEALTAGCPPSADH